MRRIIAAALLLSVFNCQKDDFIPAEPVITFESIRFVDGGFIAKWPQPDTIYVEFNVTDGDNDFGLDIKNPEHTTGIFEPYHYVNKNTGALVLPDDVKNGTVSFKDLVVYGDRVNPPFDTLPSIAGYCYDRELVPQQADKSPYVRRNPNRYNMFVDGYYTAPDGSVKSLSASNTLSCSDHLFNAIIPSLSELPLNKKINSGVFSIIKQTSRHATIARAFISESLRTYGSNYRFVISVQDRALHRSNTIETPYVEVK